MARLLVVADLHFPRASGLSEGVDYLGAAWRLPRILGEGRFDALILAGDFVNTCDEESTEKLMKMIRRHYRGPVLAAWGNHEHYLSPSRLRRGWDSPRCLERLRGVLEGYGAAILDSEGPVEVGGVWVAGVAGWYDYSYGPPGFTVEDYERCNPYGVPLPALRRCDRQGYGSSIGGGSLCPSGYRRDCLYVKLPMSNPEYARLNAERLRKQLEEAKPPVVVVTHHVPRGELLSPTGDPLKDFDLAYAGTPLLGEVLSLYREGIAAVTYGHIHGRGRGWLATLDGVPYVDAFHGHGGFTAVEVEKAPEGFTARVVIIAHQSARGRPRRRW